MSRQDSEAPLMRKSVLGLCALVLMNTAVWAETLKFHDLSTGAKKAPSFTVDVTADWKPADGPSMYHLVVPEEEPSYTRSLSGFSTMEDQPLGGKGTADMLFAALSKSDNGKSYERVSLGELPAVVERDKRSFQVWAFSGKYKVSLHYADGQDSSKPYDGDAVLTQVLRSFRPTR